MTKAHREVLDAMLREIEKQGGCVDGIRHGRHLVVYWSVCGVKLTSPAPRTASDWRAARNNIADIRRQARRAAKDTAHVA